jgi:hypothetical protein
MLIFSVQDLKIMKQKEVHLAVVTYTIHTSRMYSSYKDYQL